MPWRSFRHAGVWIGTLAVAARLLPGPRTVDDAYITFRYARNLLVGHGLVYNPGEAVLGTTTPVYALVMAALGAATGGPEAPFPVIAWALNALLGGLTCWLIIRIGEALGFPVAGTSAALIWAIAPMSVTFDIGGMETEATIALMAGTFLAYLSDRRLLTAALAAACLLTRPDTMLFIAPLALERLRSDLTINRQIGQAPSRLWKEAAIFALPLLLWTLFALSTYGNPLPQSIAAKTLAYRLPPEAGFVRLLQHYGTPFLEHLTFGTDWIAFGLLAYPVLAGLGSLMAIREHPGAWPFLAYPWIYLAAFGIANPLIFRWYLAPPLPAYFFAIFLGAGRLSRDTGRRWIAWAVLAFAFLLSVRGWALRLDHGPARPAPEMAFIKLELLYEQVGRELAGRLFPGEVIGAGDIGALGYVTQAPILDTIGLITPLASDYYPLPADDYVINYAIPSALITDHQPDYLVILEVYGRRTLLQDDDFLDGYSLLWIQPTDIYGSEGMLVFKRVDPP